MNIGIIKHTALNLIRKNQKKRESIKAIRKIAGWNNDRLTEILFYWRLPPDFSCPPTGIFLVQQI